MNLLWNRKVLQMLKVFMEPFRQTDASMASWSTFIFKSVPWLDY